MTEENKFLPVSVHDTRAFLQSGVATGARLSIWTEGQKYGFISRIQNVSDQGELLFISVPMEVEGDEFEKSVRSAGVFECMFALHLPTDLVYFKGEMRRSDGSAISFKVEIPIYKLQRRLSLRLPAPSGEEIKVKFSVVSIPGRIHETKLRNFSDGGIGIMFSDEALFKAVKEGATVRDIGFIISGIPVSAAGIVRHALSLPGGKVKDRFRLGIQFTQIDAKLKERLSRFTLEASTKFFGRI